MALPGSKTCPKKFNKVQHNKQTNIQSRINQIIEKSPQEMKIRLHSIKGYIIIDPNDILYCKADGTTTDIYFTNNRIEYTQMFLSKLEELLAPYDFLRISRSFLINRKYIRKTIKATSTIILSYNGKKFEVKGSKQSIKNLSNIDDE
jgi:two-component system, LytTR family, response regulator